MVILDPAKNAQLLVSFESIKHNANIVSKMETRKITVTIFHDALHTMVITKPGNEFWEANIDWRFGFKAEGTLYRAYVGKC